MCPRAAQAPCCKLGQACSTHGRAAGAGTGAGQGTSASGHRCQDAPAGCTAQGTACNPPRHCSLAAGPTSPGTFEGALHPCSRARPRAGSGRAAPLRAGLFPPPTPRGRARGWNCESGPGHEVIALGQSARAGPASRPEWRRVTPGQAALTPALPAGLLAGIPALTLRAPGRAGRDGARRRRAGLRASSPLLAAPDESEQGASSSTHPCPWHPGTQASWPSVPGHVATAAKPLGQRPPPTVRGAPRAAQRQCPAPRPSSTVRPALPAVPGLGPRTPGAAASTTVQAPHSSSPASLSHPRPRAPRARPGVPASRDAQGGQCHGPRATRCSSLAHTSS